MGLLKDRVAVTTGPSKGIGRVMSLCFARERARVVCAARSAPVRETAAMVRAAGGEALDVQCNAADETAVRRTR